LSVIADKGKVFLMISVRVFDPAMCCSTGICGPSVDPRLARFAADLNWLKNQGVAVERFNLSQQPGAFADDATVKTALETKGEAGLPLVKVNGEVKSSGTYPSRVELAAWAGVPAGTSEESTPRPDACCSPASKSDLSVSKKSGCC
jgi:hypothetical protein